MLIFADARLTFLATPKTGTTAVEMALRSQADIIIAKKRKHMNAHRYVTKFAPFLARTFGIRAETVAVMRDPVDQLRSWYKYRTREGLVGSPRSTAQMSFDDFVLAAAQETPPAFAQVGSQFSFLTDPGGTLLVDHLFDYADQPAFLAFLSQRIGTDITLRQKNVSPNIQASLSEQSLETIKSARADEFALYGRLQAAGGYLKRV